MWGSSGKAVLAAGMLAAGLAGTAVAQQPQTVTPGQPQASQVATQQAAPASDDATQQALRDQAAMLKAQGQRIEDLEAQLRELTAILSNRVDRIEAQTDSGKVIATNPGPRIEGPNARNSMTFIGMVQAGAGAVLEQDDSSPAAPDVHGGTEIRRARIGVQGVAFSDFAYQAEIDLAGTSGVASGARDIYVQYNGFRPFAITVGNVKPQTGMETSFSDRSNAQTFLESSTLSSMYTSTGARNIGMRITTGGDHWSGSLGLFGDDITNNSVATPGEEGYGVHGRLTWAPVATSTSLLHFGVSGYDRRISSDNTNTSQFRVRSQPESTIDAARLVDTGNLTFAENARLVGFESAGLLGPVGYQAEWGRVEIERVSGRPDATFDGAYVGANWFLTGESRIYDPRTGVFTRFAPKTNASPSEGKWGAWELAARWSRIDLDSDPDQAAGTTLLGVRGGKQTDYTAALNWYWNPYFRLMLNYVHAEAENRTNALPGIGVDEGTTLDLLGLRAQQEW